jgi:hypothetical protein
MITPANAVAVMDAEDAIVKTYDQWSDWADMHAERIGGYVSRFNAEEDGSDTVLYDARGMDLMAWLERFGFWPDEHDHTIFTYTTPDDLGPEVVVYMDGASTTVSRLRKESRTVEWMATLEGAPMYVAASLIRDAASYVSPVVSA